MATERNIEWEYFLWTNTKLVCKQKHKEKASCNYERQQPKGRPWSWTEHKPEVQSCEEAGHRWAWTGGLSSEWGEHAHRALRGVPGWAARLVPVTTAPTGPESSKNQAEDDETPTRCWKESGWFCPRRKKLRFLFCTKCGTMWGICCKPLSEGQERATQRPPDTQKGSYCSLLARNSCPGHRGLPRGLWVKFRFVNEYGGKMTSLRLLTSRCTSAFPTVMNKARKPSAVSGPCWLPRWEKKIFSYAFQLL